ncbi:hypothetical protein [Sphingomonas azotifigens]|nr:hypothetical protein [Sphingomonas azotifigens]
MTDRMGTLDRLLALVHALLETAESLTLEVPAALSEFMACRRQQAQKR